MPGRAQMGALERAQEPAGWLSGNLEEGWPASVAPVSPIVGVDVRCRTWQSVLMATTNYTPLPTLVMPRGGSWITLAERQGDAFYGNDGFGVYTVAEIALALLVGEYVDATPFLAWCEAQHASGAPDSVAALDAFWATQS